MTGDVETAFLQTRILSDPEYDQFFHDIVILGELKQLLINHGKTIQQLHDAGVNPRQIACTGAVLLFGPQGHRPHASECSSRTASTSTTYTTVKDLGSGSQSRDVGTKPLTSVPPVVRGRNPGGQTCPSKHGE